jgi:hypothetical protein
VEAHGVVRHRGSHIFFRYKQYNLYLCFVQFVLLISSLSNRLYEQQMNMKVSEKFRIPKNSFGVCMYSKLLFILPVFFVLGKSFTVLCVTLCNTMFRKRESLYLGLLTHSANYEHLMITFWFVGDFKT